MLPDLSQLPPEAQQQIQQIEQQAQQQIAELQKQVTVEAIGQLLKDQKLRPFVLDIETDSTIQPDENAEKQKRVEFMGALGPLLQQGVMAMQQAPQLAPFVAESIRFVASGFRAGRQMDDAIDELAEQFANYQPPPDPGGEDPALAQAQLETEKVKADAAKAKGEADIQIAGVNAKIKELELTTKQQELTVEVPKTQAETQKLMAETDKIRGETALQGREMDLQEKKMTADVQRGAQELELNAKKTDADIQRGSEEVGIAKQKTTAEIARGDKEVALAEKKIGHEGRKVDNDARASGVIRKKKTMKPERDGSGRITRVTISEEDAD
jgi:hypothetical protein